MENDRNGKARVIPFPRPSTPRSDEPEETGKAQQSEEHSYATPMLDLKKRSSFVRKAMLALPRWVTPNGVTLFRMILIVPIAVLLRFEAYWPALALLGFAMLLDFVDGALAVARNEMTQTGAFLDPLADKVLVCGTLFTVLDRLPRLFVLPVAIACTIAVLLTMIRIVKMARRRPGPDGPQIAAKPAGKLKLVAETASMLCIVLGLAVGAGWLVWTGGAFLLVALYYAVGSLKSQAFG